MKQKTITTDKATLLVVELDKFTDVDCPIEIHGNKLVSSQSKGLVINTTKLPEGNWQLLGRIPDITEEQWKGIVDDTFTFINQSYNPLLNKKIIRYKDYQQDNMFTSSTDSGVSLLQANEIYFENTFGDEPKITSGEYDDNGYGDIDKHQFKRDLKSWQEAQSKVWDKERCYLFIKGD